LVGDVDDIELHTATDSLTAIGVREDVRQRQLLRRRVIAQSRLIAASLKCVENKYGRIRRQGGVIGRSLMHAHTQLASKTFGERRNERQPCGVVSSLAVDTPFGQIEAGLKTAIAP
jgi:hypothetical protein